MLEVYSTKTLNNMYIFIRCVCPSGFRKIGSTGSDECEDIDECFHNPDICGEGGECKNTQGKYEMVKCHGSTSS